MVQDYLFIYLFYLAVNDIANVNVSYMIFNEDTLIL